MPKKSAKKTEKKENKIESKKLSDKEYETHILKLSKEGLTSEKIGESLRKEGIHPKEHKKISIILKENNSYVQPDLKNVEAKMARIIAHFEKNAQDKRAKREKDRVVSQLRRLKRYYQTA
ncbi:MAG: hypothetical protein Q7S56_02075 [Nanoarchaeota archaeon]|nr:hypothetical protein [Nanoarchaeota archaeon]